MNADYKRGYAAGRKRGEKDAAAEKWNAVYLAVLPTAMRVSTWTLNKKKVTTGEEHVELARVWTREAVRNMK